MRRRVIQTSDLLLLSMDNNSSNGDIPVLTVGRRENNKLNVIKTYTGEEALKIYENLTNTN